MITLAWYLLKVIICSGVLFGYYYVALRNKIFHRWNRFYLLASIIISLTVPVMKINIFQDSNGDKGTAVRMLQAINRSDEIVIEYSRNNGFRFQTENVIEAVYLLIAFSLLAVFLVSLYKIFRLRKSYPETKMKGINFISTNASGTPFSFFNSIFWNNAIDLHSTQGQKIFNHEIAHVKEKHSYDKLFMNIVLILFWANPFFWLMRKELNMIHEFIADQKAVEDNDISAFADMILHTVYPGQNFSLTNKFFYSPLKRRILMLTQNKNPKVSYLSRLLVLPFTAIVFFAFTIKLNTIDNAANYEGKTITVVIDAGHGGNDNGAISLNGVNEKDINLSISKKVEELNSNDHIKILLSRPDDKFISVKDRVEFAKANHADLFISIHLDASGNNASDKNVFSVLIDKANSDKNKLLASAIIYELKKSYPTESSIGIRQNNIWVLDKNTCPAVLIECGYLTNAADEAFIVNKNNQEKIAKNILDAISRYASSVNDEALKAGEIKTLYNTASTDTMPIAFIDTIPEMIYKNKRVTNIEVNNENAKFNVTYSDGSKETITQQEAKKRGFLIPPPPPPPVPAIAPVPPVEPAPPVGTAPPPPPPAPSLPENALYIINDKVSSIAEVKLIPKKNIERKDVLKGKDAVDAYGEKGKNGVIKIKRKSVSTSREEVINEEVNNKISPIYLVDEKEISKDEMNNISPNSIQSINVLKGERAINKYGEKGKNGVVEINLKSGPYTKADTIPDKLFTKVENEAEFPGGRAAWIKYIVGKVQANKDTLTDSDFGTCLVKFIVNKDGSITNVEATNMKNTQLARIAVEAIKTGPKWIPATQNNMVVASYRLQPVTLTDPAKK